MNFRRAIFVLCGSFLLASGLAVQSLAASAPDENLVRVHWLGMKEISADTNAAHFMGIWQLPQTTALVSQTLDKLSRWPGGGVTNVASALLRPLLDDLVSSEFYLELYAPTNSRFTIHDSRLFLAVRLPAARASLWQANLAALPDQIESSHVGQWTFVGLGQGTNDLLPKFATRIASSHAPSVTNFWLEADLNSQLWPLLSCYSSLSRLNFTVTGEAGDVLTRGTLNFSRPLDEPLPSWEMPTNFIHEPLTSFTAIRGLAAWLAALPAWQKLQLAPPPDQMFFWAQDGVPFQTYFAAPLPAASNQVNQLAIRLVQNANPWLVTHGEGDFQWQPKLSGLVWNDAFIISPFLKPVIVDQRDFVLGGLYPLGRGALGASSAGHLRAVLADTNLVYFQSEQTWQRVEDDLFITQLFRVVLHQAQLPNHAAATLWLKSLEPLLGDSTTTIIKTGEQRFTFTRHSTVGFAALELHLIADWLESPQFPCGLHTFTAPAKPR